MIYTYEQLKGVIKVGDKVRAVKGELNPCDELYHGKVGTITSIGDGSLNNTFFINSCRHNYEAKGTLEIIDRIPTWDTLQVGDVLMSVFNEGESVIFISGELVVLKDSSGNASTNYTRDELPKTGYTINTPEPQEVELTLPQIAEKFNLKVEQIRIKE